MSCPHAEAMADPVGQAIARCPFLSNVARAQGESFARQVATRPHATANSHASVQRKPLLEEDFTDFSSAVRAFHGPGGIVPLKRFAESILSGGTSAKCPWQAAHALPAEGSKPPAAVSPMHGLRAAAAAPSGNASTSTVNTEERALVPSQQRRPQQQRTPASRAGAGASRRPAAAFAAISLGGSFGPLPNPQDILRVLGKHKKPNPQKHQQGTSQQPGGNGSGPSNDRVTNPNKPSSGRLRHSAPGSGAGGGGRGAAATSAGTGSTSQPMGSKGGRCPMRKFVEPLGGLIPLGTAALSRLQGMKCPSAIVAARAVVARTEVVKQLRPQTLAVKMLAIGAFAGWVNMPFGMWREHTEKFSPAWFAAVHTPIPFVAILRKAVLMPKWAMALTFSAAVLGQAIGASLERQRLAGTLSAPWAEFPARHTDNTLSAPGKPVGVAGAPRSKSKASSSSKRRDGKQRQGAVSTAAGAGGTSADGDELAPPVCPARGWGMVRGTPRTCGEEVAQGAAESTRGGFGLPQAASFLNGLVLSESFVGTAR